MREYAGIAYRSCPEPTTRSMLGVIDYYLHDLSKGMHRISVGEIPDGSGDPIGDAKLSDIYLVLLGRPGNQVAHGGKSAGGTLTLASTTHATKGFVYLGNAKQSAYDEVNERLGINEPAPDARLHLKHLTGSGTQTALPQSTRTAGWGVVGAASSHLATQTDDGNTSYVLSGADGSNGYVCAVDFTTLLITGTPAAGTVSVKVVACADVGGSAGTADLALYTNNDVTLVFGYTTSTVNTSSATYATYTYTLSASEINTIVTTGNWANLTVRLRGSRTWAAVRVTQIHITAPSSLDAVPLQKWENAATSNELNYVADAANATTLQLSGTPKFRITSGLELDIGAPLVADFWRATDTEGTGAWDTVTAADFPHVILDSTVHTDTLTGTVVAGDVIIGNATPKWSRLALSVPAANVRNVFGVDNAETLPSWKTALDGTAPTTIAVGATPAAGTSLVFSHRDHTHGAPATWAATAHHLLDGSIHDDTLAHTPVVLGDLIYGNATPKWAALAADTSNTRKFLRTLSVAGTGQAPAWDALQAADIPDLSTGYVTINTVQTITAPKTISVGADLVPLTLKAASGTPSLLTCLLGAATKFTVGYSGAIEYMGDYITFGNALTLISGGSAFPQTVEIPGSIGSGVLAVRGAGPDPAASTGDIAQVNRVGASAIGTSSGGILGPLKLTFGAPAGFYMIHGSLEVVTAIASRSLTVTLAWTGAQAQTGRVILGPMHMDAGEISTCGMAIYSGTGDISWSTTVSGGANLSTGRANLRFRVTYLGA